MPSSRPNAVPVVVHLIKQLRPSSILDVGIGFGKWGHLFREYTDIIASQSDPPRYHRDNWQVRIDGVEGFPDYITDMHRYLYNNIYIGDVRDVVKELGTYDVIFLGDIIEHVTKSDGIALINAMLPKVNKAIILSTPKYETGQEDLNANELERHRSLWTAADFLSFPGAHVATVTQTMLIAVIAKPGAPPLRIAEEIAGKPKSLGRKLYGKMRRTLKGFMSPSPSKP